MNKIFNQNLNIIDKEKKNKVKYLLNKDINEWKKDISYLKLLYVRLQLKKHNKYR